MPAAQRHPTRYPGVTFIETKAPDGRMERSYYIRYRRDGKLVEEKAGKQFRDDMTPAKAARLRTLRIEGQAPTNQARREEEAGKWTVKRLWASYKEARPDLKGIVTDENRFSKYIGPAYGEKVPEELAPLDIDRLRIKLQKQGKSPGTVKNVLELLRRIVNFGVDRQLIPPLKFTIKLPRVNNLKTEDLTPDQLTSLLQAIDEEPNLQAANFMRMAMLTGLRRGELFRLQWRDIDFDRGFLLLRDPKGGTDQRIPLNATAIALLKKHPRQEESPYVFPGRGGAQRTDIKKQVNRIKERAGLPADFRALHGLRHVYASTLASSGKVDMYTLQKLLTHKSPQMTQRYAHLRDEALKRAADVAGDIFEGLAAREPAGNVIKLDQKQRG